MVKETLLRSRHKNKIESIIRDLEYTVKDCNNFIPHNVERAMSALKEAVDDKVLYAEEENTYKKIISGHIERFENTCKCLIKVK